MIHFILPIYVTNAGTEKIIINQICYIEKMKLYQQLKALPQKISLHIKIAIISWITRTITAFIQLLNIRILISYLGTDLYSSFVILTSLYGWFALFECGIGSSLQNFISEQNAKDEDYNNYLHATVVLLLIVIIMSIPFIILIADPLQKFLFKNNAQFTGQPTFLLLLVGLFYVIQSLCSVAYRVYYAEQRGHLSSIYPAIGSTVSFLGLLTIDYFNIKKGNLTLSLVVFIVPGLSPALYSFFDIFIRKQNFFRNNLDLIAFKSLIRRSYKFAVFALFAAMVLQLDYIIMSRILQPKDITIYNIISKVYFFMHFFYAAVLLALWPNCTELLTKKEWKKVNSLIKIHILAGITLIIIGTITFILSRNLINSILVPDKNLNIYISTILFFCFYYILRIWTDTYATMLQSMSKLKVFWLYVPVQGLISIAGQYYFGIKFGINGILIGLLLSFLLVPVWILPKVYYKIAR